MTLSTAELGYLLEHLRAPGEHGDPALVRALDRERGWAWMRERVHGLAPADAVQAVIVEWEWADATDHEVAEVTGLSVEAVREHRLAWERSSSIRTIMAKARELTVALGYAGRPSELVLDALRAFARGASRSHLRAREAA